MPTQYRVPALFTLLYLTILTAPGVALGAEKVIIDTDPGVDDSLAIVFALKSKQLEILQSKKPNYEQNWFAVLPQILGHKF